LICTAARTRRAANAPNPTAPHTADVTVAVKPGLLAALCCALTFLAGCGPHVQPDAPSGVNLAGSWRLNRQASADPDALITAIVEKEMKHMRRRARPEDEEPDELPPPPAPGEAGSSSSNRKGHRSETVVPPSGMFRPRGGMAAYLRSQYTDALGGLLNGEGVVIEQANERFVVTRGDSRRSFTPGGHSVVGVANGVADQNSGWNGREYVIDVRPQVGPHVTERYTLGSNGQLIEKVSLSGDGLPKLDFTRVYDKGAPPTRALPGA
jgi:hypothetical protein